MTHPGPSLAMPPARSGPAARSGTARAPLGQGSGTAWAQRPALNAQNTTICREQAGGVLADTSRFTVFRARSRTGIVDRAACGGPLAALATSPGERALRSPGRPLAGPAPGRLAATDGVRRPGGLTAAVTDPQGQRHARRLRRSRIPRRHAGGAQDRHHRASLLGVGR